MAKKEKKEPEKPSTAWQGTYGDMITLMLCFFVMLFDPESKDAIQMAAMTAAISGDPTAGGQSLATGRLADLGNTVSSLPSLEKGKSLGPSAKRAVSIFAPEINKTNKITISSDERGLVISLASDAFFEYGSAELNIEESRDVLLRLAQFLSSDELYKDPDGNIRKYRIEGHTDSSPFSSELYPSNWELSAARAANVLHYLSDYGADEDRFVIAGYADNQPMRSNDTEEGRAYNRRVDIIILDEGHF